ncbi:hypothetical protein ACIQAC_28725 [Streptomyces sp. NPDC088387]|uniref:hypothetical protein n=1 Tax=Streptomyces sp. NPDC088387 TaxID=3365859 RepID=UPI003806F0CD
MGTKTDDEAETGTAATTAARPESNEVTDTDAVTESEGVEKENADNGDNGDSADNADNADNEEPDSAAVADGDDLEPEAAEVRAEGPSGVGQGAAAVVSAVLGLVALTGSWVGTVASARENITGQLEMQASTNATVEAQLEAVYGNAWQATALWGGIFALVAALVGAAVLVRPAFGAPGRPQAVWIKSVSWAGVALGVIGLILAVLKYTDVLLGIPSTS